MLDLQDTLNRRTFLQQSANGLGLAALGSMLRGTRQRRRATDSTTRRRPSGSSTCSSPAPRRRWISSTRSPRWSRSAAKTCPTASARASASPTMTSGQKTFPVAPSIFKFAQHGQSGPWLSELLPHTAKIADDICIIRSMHTEAINHDPAITFFQTGSQLAGRPSIGSWVSYGLGSDNEDLPALRRAHLARHRPAGRPAALRPAVGHRLPAHPASGRRSSATRATRCSTSQTRRASTAPSAATCSTTWPNSTADAQRDRRSGDPGAHRPVRDGLPDAEQRAGAHRRLGRTATRARPLRAGRQEARAPTPRTACSPAAWRSATCASSSSSTWAGTTTAACRRHSRGSAGHRPARPRPDPGPETARPARRHAAWSGAASSAAPSTRRER